MIFVWFLITLHAHDFCAIYLRTSPCRWYLFRFLVHCSARRFGHVQWRVLFPLAIRLIWGNGVVLWWVHSECLMLDAVIMRYRSTVYTSFFFKDNWRTAHDLWWFFLSHQYTVFITEAMIMSNVDFVSHVSFYLLNDNWSDRQLVGSIFGMVPFTSLYYVGSWHSDHEQCWSCFFSHLFRPLPW
jgi:hypothetical protein